ncbi:Metallophosphoesterase [Chondrus crispus]|uniref:Metallophosphoesterase n=1 Tax=Chondrus crispus TaxID=2769 RepID=R7QDR1_CHOCR|nr:Metallophosphoesterase [Chondrus crispus]CDF36652.1 Metallophosphoesterase [Chondrus crispus]|eukprot:XP_005716471.1 Metallophosphoesterase [Chondrus crispus]
MLFPQNKRRHYRAALTKTERAVASFNESDALAVVHLGDIIDGVKECGIVSTERTYKDLRRVLSVLSHLRKPLLHVLGNHCVLLERESLLTTLKIEKPGYYYRNLSSMWRLIVIDTVDVSLNRDRRHPHFAEARDYLQAHRGEPHAKLWNGGLGAKQTRWLEQILARTAADGRFAVVCGHIPIVEEASESEGVIYGHKEVEKVLAAHGCVKAYFSGHHHAGGYAHKGGIHHVTFEGIIDADDDNGAFALVELRKDKIVVRGRGTMTSRALQIG